MKKYQIYIGSKLGTVGPIAGGQLGPIFDSEQEAKAYCQEKTATDPNSSYIPQEMDDGRAG